MNKKDFAQFFLKPDKIRVHFNRDHFYSDQVLLVEKKIALQEFLDFYTTCHHKEVVIYGRIEDVLVDTLYKTSKIREVSLYPVKHRALLIPEKLHPIPLLVDMTSL